VRISAKGEYAIKAMLDLALSDVLGLRPIQEIASRQRIPQRYLEQVLLQLKRAGLLQSKRGSAGGYRLGRTPERVTVGDILRAVEGEHARLEPVRRHGRSSPEEPDADLSELWQEVADAVSAVVDRVTLEDLKRRVEDRRSAARAMYHI
jgi:Rrf2 family protein